MSLLLSNCGTTIHDFKTCDLVPSVDQQGVLHPSGAGSACDNFLTHAPQTNTEDQWQAIMLAWVKSGEAVSCTQSSSITQLKGEVEKLCEDAPWYAKCNETVKKNLLAGLERVIALKQLALAGLPK